MDPRSSVLGPSNRLGPVSVGRCYAATSYTLSLSVAAGPAALRRGDQDGQFCAQKLLYILLHLQHWVWVTGDVMAQSYEPDKMWS